MNLGARVLGSGKMISALIGFLAVLICLSLWFGSIPLIYCGLFDTEYMRQQFRTVHYVRQVTKGKIWHTTTYESELVEYKKKWWQLYKYEPLPDKWVFDSEETKKLWERINND